MELSIRQQAVWLADRSDYDAAHGLFIEWLRRNPDDLYVIWVCHWLVERHKVYVSHADDEDAADAKIERALSDDVELFRRASRFAWERRFGDAAEILQSLAARRASWPMAWMVLGDCLQNRGDEEEARAAYLTALEADPLFLPALDRIADVDCDAGRFDRAEEFAQRAASIRSALSRYSFLGQAGMLAAGERIRGVGNEIERIVSLMREGRAREATIPIRKLLAAEPENLPVNRLFAYFANQRGELPLIRHELSLDHVEEKSVARLYLEGLFAWYADEDESALATFDRALEKSTHPFLISSRGYALLALERRDEAEEVLASALARAPWLTRARLRIAEAALERGDFARVIEIADMEPWVRDHALRWEHSGADDLPELEQLALTAMQRRGDIAGALHRMTDGATEPGLLLRQALVLAASGDRERAAPLVDESLRRNPMAWEIELADLDLLEEIGTHGARLARAIAVARLRSVEEGHALIAELFARDPDHTPTRCLSALAAAHEDRDDDALALFKTIVADDSDPPKRVIQAYTSMLFKRKDVDALIRLAAAVPKSTEPLRAAQTLLEPDDDGRLAEVDRELIRRGYFHPAMADREAAAMKSRNERMLHQIDSSTNDLPLLFHFRAAAARLTVQMGELKSARERYESLIADGGEPPEADLLAYALASTPDTIASR